MHEYFHTFMVYKIRKESNVPLNMVENFTEVEKGVEHGSIAPRRKWREPFLAEGFGPSLPHLSRFL